MSEGESLLSGLCANPDENAAALVLADWLQERGAESLALALRAAVAFRSGQKAYLVTSGEYSDYRVRGVFTSRENAERFMDASREQIGSQFNEIEEYTIDLSDAPLRAGLVPFSVQMRRDGNDASVVRVDADTIADNGRLADIWIARERVPGFRINLWARGEHHAIKIANDKRIAALVSQVPQS